MQENFASESIVEVFAANVTSVFPDALSKSKEVKTEDGQTSHAENSREDIKAADQEPAIVEGKETDKGNGKK